jgi:hypothetical protein
MKRDDFGNFLGSILSADARGIQEKASGLDPITRKRLAHKLSLLSNMMLQSSMISNDCHKMKVSLHQEPRRGSRRWGGDVNSQNDFDNK